MFILEDAFLEGDLVDSKTWLWSLLDEALFCSELTKADGAREVKPVFETVLSTIHLSIEEPVRSDDSEGAALLALWKSLLSVRVWFEQIRTDDELLRIFES